jgi:hypothetical protein
MLNGIPGAQVSVRRSRTQHNSLYNSGDDSSNVNSYVINKLVVYIIPKIIFYFGLSNIFEK